MREFFDTSVLIAAFWAGHRDHLASLKRFECCEQWSICLRHAYSGGSVCDHDSLAGEAADPTRASDAVCRRSSGPSYAGLIGRKRVLCSDQDVRRARLHQQPCLRRTSPGMRSKGQGSDHLHLEPRTFSGHRPGTWEPNSNSRRRSERWLRLAVAVQLLGCEKPGSLHPGAILS